MDAATAAGLIASGDRVYLREVAMTPHDLVDALVERAGDLRNGEVVALHTEGPMPHAR